MLTKLQVGVSSFISVAVYWTLSLIIRTTQIGMFVNGAVYYGLDNSYSIIGDANVCNDAWSCSNGMCQMLASTNVAHVVLDPLVRVEDIGCSIEILPTDLDSDRFYRMVFVTNAMLVVLWVTLTVLMFVNFKHAFNVAVSLLALSFGVSIASIVTQQTWMDEFGVPIMATVLILGLQGLSSLSSWLIVANYWVGVRDRAVEFLD